MASTPLTKLALTNFTAFDSFSLDLTSGLNVFVGANGTGKTHLMKVLYDACSISVTGRHFVEKLVADFLPEGRQPLRLVHRQPGSTAAELVVSRDRLLLTARFTNHTKTASQAEVSGEVRWSATELNAVYIPVKEILSHSPGFAALYAAREIAFEELYVDLINQALLPLRRGQPDPARRKLLEQIHKILAGKVNIKEDRFYLRSGQGLLEFPLLAEGMRKLGLLWVLIQNGSLTEGSVLFWDEPEANLNPRVIGELAEMLLVLQRHGVQAFVATHDYVLLKELQLRAKPRDRLIYHALSRNETGRIVCSSTDDADRIEPNTIVEAFGSLYDRQLERFAKGQG